MPYPFNLDLLHCRLPKAFSILEEDNLEYDCLSLVLFAWYSCLCGQIRHYVTLLFNFTYDIIFLHIGTYLLDSDTFRHS